MTQEQKDLLLKDLCARLPYNPLVEYKGESYNVLGIAHGRLVLCKPFMSYTLNENPLVEEVKPYLFPMSSMSEEQLVIYGDLCYAIIHSLAWDMQAALNELVDWLNENHFDYNNLIPMGLALDATGKNIY